MKLSLEQLETLDSIARRGSFAAAADELHRVPSAITYTVRQLEERVGAAIFDRSGHRAKLTPVGELLLKEGRRLLAAAEDLECRVQRLATGWEAELRVAVSDLYAVEELWPLVKDFHAAATGTRLALRREVFGGCWDALLSGRADLVIGAPGDGPAGGGYKARKLGDVQWRFAVAPGHPLADAVAPVDAFVLQRHRIVAAEDSSRVLPPRQSGVHVGQEVLNVPDLATKLSAQLAGVGGGFLPAEMVARYAAEGALVVVDVEELKPPTPLWLAWRSGETGRALHWWLARVAGLEISH